MEPIEKKMDLQSIIKGLEESLGEPVAERWWVEEYTPAYTNDDDRDVPERVYEKSKYFDTKADAVKHFRRVKPTYSENKLRIRKQTCYERVERHWV